MGCESSFRREFRVREWRCGWKSALPGLLVLLAGCGGEPADSSSSTPAQVQGWYASVDGRRVGPFTELGLQTELITERLGDDALVWKEGVADWRPAGEVFGRTAAQAPGTSAEGRAFLALVDRASRVSDREMMILIEHETPSGAVPRPSEMEVRAVLEGREALLSDARAGLRAVGRLEHDYARGAFMLLPHLAPSRQLAKLLRHDAIFRAANGDRARANEDCAAIARIARQVAADDVAISSLVSMAIVRLLADACAQIGSQPGTSASLRDATAWLRADDPFHLADACRVERDHTVAMVAAAIREGLLDEYAAVASISGPARRSLLAIDAERLDEEVERCRAAYDALAARLEGARRPRQIEIDALVAAIERGEYGPLAEALVPAVARITEGAGDTLDRVDAVIERGAP